MILPILGGLFKAFAAVPDTLIGENMRNVTFTEDKGVYSDTARGYFKIMDVGSISSGSVSRRKAEKITMVLMRMELHDFTSTLISDSFLENLQSDLDLMRNAGFLVTFRPTYDTDGVKQPEPHSLDLILEHINQICKVLSKNADILYAVQPGMLGSYGEWHNSYYEDSKTGYISADVQEKVVKAFYSALPSSVPLQLRRPVFIRGLTDNASVTAANAFGSSLVSRLGYHNDALLSSASDMGTYSDKAYTREQELTWTNSRTRFLPLIGEANHLSEYCEPTTAVQLLDLLNVQSINGSYNDEVMSQWKSTAYRNEDTYTYIQKKLGYRFILNKAGFNSNTWQGNFLHLNLQFSNDGFANLLRPTDFEIIISNGNQTYTAKIDDDPRFWNDDAGTITKDFYFSIPSDAPAGNYTVSLRLSSSYSSLKNNPLYNIRFASEGVWDAAAGINNIGSIVIGKPETTGIVVSEFEQISKSRAAALNNSGSSYYNISSVDFPLTDPGLTETEPKTVNNGKFMSFSDNGVNLYLTLNGIDLNSKRQIFLNTDNNESTGYYSTETKKGYEWLIEGTRLYRYGGDDGSHDWSWLRNTSFTAIEYENSADYIISLSTLGIGKDISITALYRADDDKSTDTAEKYTHFAGTDAKQPENNELAVNPVDETHPPANTVLPSSYSILLSQDNSSIVINQNNINTKSRQQVFFDTDGNNQNGYAISLTDNNAGYDFMLENYTLYAYAGTTSQRDWTWTRIGKSNFITSPDSNSHIISLSQLGITAPCIINTVYRQNEDKTTDVSASCIVDGSAFTSQLPVTEPSEPTVPEITVTELSET
jgi:hypothetical protein